MTAFPINSGRKIPTLTTSPDNMPLISVYGATSKQGRSVARTLLESGRFRVRAIARTADSAEARELTQLGAQIAIVPAGLGRRQELVEAFTGSQGAYLMTPPVDPRDHIEYALGQQLTDAAVEAGVGHIVFSSLEDVARRTGDRKPVPHFTNKARIADYIRGHGVRHSFVMLAYFYTNFLEYYPPRMEDGKLVMPIYLPEDFRAPFVDPLTATGPVVLDIFSNPDAYEGAAVPIVGDVLSPREMVETFRRVTGIKAEYRNAFTREGLLNYFPDFGANEALVEELVGMVEYSVEYGYFDKTRDLEWSRRIDPDALTWERFLQTTGWQGDRQSFGN